MFSALAVARSKRFEKVVGWETIKDESPENCLSRTRGGDDGREKFNVEEVEADDDDNDDDDDDDKEEDIDEEKESDE